MTQNLDRRARKILKAVVKEFLQSGDAVGSRTVTRRHDIGLSPATVRNVMADLEELGLLTQPHTSAGRVPTHSGLRFFIDSLLKVRGLSAGEKETIRQHFADSGQKGPGTRTGSTVAEVIETTSRLLAQITCHTGIVLSPSPAMQRFRHIEFVPLHQGQFLCILVTSEGQIENKLIRVEVDVEPERLARIHNYLDALFRGLTLAEVRQRVLSELGKEKNAYDAMVSAALRLSKAVFDGTDKSGDVVVMGQANLVDLARDGDAENLERMRALLDALEDKEVVLQLLDQAMKADGIQVFLGYESAATSLGDSSVVAVPYGPEEQPIGAIAVIGPMRMNYGKVMSVVDFTAELVSQIIDEL